MKKLLTIAVTLMMAVASYAGCGIKVPVTGEAKAYDAEKKTPPPSIRAVTPSNTASARV